jgi:hypothetical protein
MERSAEVLRSEDRAEDAGFTSLPLTLVSMPGTPDAAASHVELLDIAHALLSQLHCGDAPERERLILNACVVRLEAALAVGTYPYLLDSCADDVAAQITRISTRGFPWSSRRLRRVG